MPLRIATLFLALFLTGCDKKEVPTGQACGGPTGLRCPENQHCADNPNDTCDPNKDGDVCPRICVGG